VAVARKKDHSPLEVDLPITPMLDMAFQMLVFFILTYTPAALETHIDADLRPAKPAVAKAADSEPKDDQEDKDNPADENPDAEESLTVFVEALSEKDRVEPDAVGSPKRIYVQTPESDKKRLVCSQDDSLDQGLKKLEAVLVKFLRTSENAESTVVDIYADGKLKFDYLIRVQDVCKARYGIRNEGGKKVLVKIGRLHKEDQFKEVTRFQGVKFIPPPEEAAPAKPKK
jgi:biopolymer transport protein ExbD